MIRLGYILSIFCLITYSYGDDIVGCMDPGACNFNLNATIDDGSCVEPEETPDDIDDIVTSISGNSVEISWSRPCGQGNIFTYSLLDGINNSTIDANISSPHIIENLSWSATYNLIIRTSTNFGESLTSFDFTIGSEPLPGKIEGLVAEAGEASIALSWNAEEYSSTYNVYFDGEIVVSTLDNTPSAVVSDLNANIDFEFQVFGVNSEGIEGLLPSKIGPLQVLPIHQVTDISAIPGDGQITFIWESPDSYAGDSDYTYIIFDEEGDVIEGNNTQNSYIAGNLELYEQTCIKIAASHQFGDSESSENICRFPLLSKVEIDTLISGEGSVSLEWKNHPNSSNFNIYRLTTDIVNNIVDTLKLNEAPVWRPSPETAQGVDYLDTLVMANTEYGYVVVALEANYIDEGVYSDPESIVVKPLPPVEDIEVSRGSARIELFWPTPADYAGFGYSYEIYDEFGNFKKSITENRTFITDLAQDDVCCNNDPILPTCACNEYCFMVKSISLGGYGDSEYSELYCGIPKTPFGESLAWGIQIIAELANINGIPIPSVKIDEFNLIGVDSMATDGYDAEFDFQEPNVGGGIEHKISLFFSHPEWGQIFNGWPVNDYTQDIRAETDLSSSVISWDAQIDIIPIEGVEISGYPQLTFYFDKMMVDVDPGECEVIGFEGDGQGVFGSDGICIDANDFCMEQGLTYDLDAGQCVRTVYLSYQGDNDIDTFRKIEQGEVIHLPELDSDVSASISIVVGNAIPEPPINLSGLGGYREATISWEDPCCQSGLLQYPAEKFNIWRDGFLIGKNIIGNTFTDRGWNCFNGANNTYEQLMGGESNYDCTVALEPFSDYTYVVSAINIAGEGDKSPEVLQVSALGNRAPVSRAGMDITLYDLQENHDEGTVITLPIYSDFSNENRSYDPDNTYEEDGFLNSYIDDEGEVVILDVLGYRWTSQSSSEYINSELTIAIEGYGNKGFQLEVNDGTELSSIDSVFVSYLSAPAPAIVDSININAGLYDIKLDWLESIFTGESYADSNGDSVWTDKESFNDCGLDNLCAGDFYYTYPDEGEGNGSWDFDDSNYNGWFDFDDLNGNGMWDQGEGERFESWADINGNGFWDDSEPFIDELNGNGLHNEYDGGPRPRPPFYGLPFNLGPDNIATKYIIRRNGIDYKEFSADSLLYIKPSEDGDLYVEYTLLDSLLQPSTEYCYQILACNFNDNCTDSEEVCVETKARPAVTVLSPNGAEIVGNGNLDVELEFENIESISYLDIYLSYDGEFNQDSQTRHVLSTDEINTYYEDIDQTNFQGYSNQVKIKAIITDEGGYSGLNSGGSAFTNYYDDSDYRFIISDKQMIHYFEAGWHLFGTPVGLEDSNFDIIGNSIGFNWSANNQDGETPDNLFSGEGYYLQLLEGKTMELSGDLFSEFKIPLDQGWNLISNPLIEEINMGAFDILRMDGTIINMAMAIDLGLVSSRMLGFDNSIYTHMPSFNIEPFLGYWIFAYDLGDTLMIQNKLNPEVISEPNTDSDWRMKLSAHALGAGSDPSYKPLGDIITLGFSEDAIDSFKSGEDDYHLPFNPEVFSRATYLQIDNSNWISGYEELYTPYFSQDIRKSNDTLYVWDMVGEPTNITHPINPYNEIVLSWEMDDLIDEYTIFLYVGDAEINMRDEQYWTVSEEDFESMRVEVAMVEYTSGCSDEMACNYYCFTNIDCEGTIKPTPFYDNGTCEYTSCVGCSNPLASNYNPNNTEIDTDTCEFLQSFLLPSEKNIYPEDEIENRVPVFLHNYIQDNDTSEYIHGIEIQLAIDPEKIVVSDIDISTGIFSEESIEIIENNDFDDGLCSDLCSYLEWCNNGICENIPDYTFIWGYTSDIKDTLGIVLYSASNPINPYGINKMFDLVLDVTGEIGEQVTIDFVKSGLNLNQVNSNFQKLNIVEGLFQVDGSIEYYSNTDAVVDDVEVDLLGISEFTTLDTAYNKLSDSSGDILFQDVLRGDYLSIISKEDESLRGLSAVDASRIARNSVGLIEFNAHEKYIADVDLNGWINAYDASTIARFLVGNIDLFNEHGLSWRFIIQNENPISLFDQSFISRLFNGSQESIINFEYPLDWIFNPSSVDMNILDNMQVIVDALQNEDIAYVDEVLNAETLSPIVGDIINQEIVGYKIGDVDGDWWNDVEGLAKESEVTSYDIFISDDESIIDFPLTIEGKNLIEGIDLMLNFDPEIFNLDEFEIVSSTLTQDSYQTVLSQNDDGVSLVIYCTSNVKYHDGILANLKFEILNTIPADTRIDIKKFRINGNFNESAGFRVVDGESYLIAKSIALKVHDIPDEYSLSQNYPNPFNPSTNIPFALPFDSNVKVNIYDVRGRLVEKLVNSHYASGYHNISWNASHLASGLYFIHFESSASGNSKTFSKIQKSLLVK